MDNSLFEQVDNYVSSLLAPEDEALKATLKSLEQAGISNMSVSPSQGKFLQVLARAANAKRILEIGTFAGYSTIWLARILPSGGKLVTLEYSEVHAELARKNFEKAGLSDVIEIRMGKALEVLPELQNEAPFDMIFIDADKPPYLEYFEWAIRLSRPGTIIVADNVVRNGKILDENSEDAAVKGVRRLNKMLADSKEVTATIMPMVGAKEFDGMAIAVVN
jgi:caffeoyl-CoA O-methyltransferase